MNIRFPEYELYGERLGGPESQDARGFWIHCEAIRDRSRLHGWEIRPHSHRRFIQLLYIWRGAAEIITPSATTQVRVPAVVEVPRLSVHGFRFSKDVCGFVLSVVPEQLRCLEGRTEWTRAALRLRQTYLDPDDPHSMRLDLTLREIEREYERGGFGQRIMLEALVSATLMLIARVNVPDRTDASERAARDHARIERLRALIAANFRDRQPTRFYADALGVSTAHLNRLCRRETGRSIQGLVAAKIIDEACRSLVFSVHSVKQIAYNLGFEDPAYFTRFFVRQTGKQPTLYKEEQRRRLESRGGAKE